MTTNSYPQNIWLIDDDPFVNLVNKRLCELCSFGENISIFNSPVNAIDCLQKKFEAEENLPDLIFLDMRMPKMDGIDFIEKLEKMPEKVKEKCKIVFLSSTEFEGDLNQKNNKLVIDFFSKPLSKEYIDVLKVKFFKP